MEEKIVIVTDASGKKLSETTLKYCSTERGFQHN